MSKDSREQEFKEQVERTNRQVVDELLNNDHYSDLREFYKSHYDEIDELLHNRNVRQVVEDFWVIEPSLKTVFNDNFLFVTNVNKAMKAGFLSKNMFE